jgi:hypothetical protein
MGGQCGFKDCTHRNDDRKGHTLCVLYAIPTAKANVPKAPPTAPTDAAASEVSMGQPKKTRAGRSRTFDGVARAPEEIRKRKKEFLKAMGSHLLCHFA